MVRPHNIAVVGGGISGLGAAYILKRNGCTVSLFEKEQYVGGHTLTDETGPCPVDLGFQVFNLTTYPNFVEFLEHLGVDTEPSNMSFSLSMDDGALEWASHDLGSVFAQRKNLLRPQFWWMLREVLRFGSEAPKVLGNPEYDDVTLGAYLDLHGYSTFFKYRYLLPMCAAIWSVPNAVAMKFPVQTLVQFWVNHHLLQILDRPLWRVVRGRSRSYVDAVLPRAKVELPGINVNTTDQSPQKPLHNNPIAELDHVHRGTEVVSVRQVKNGEANSGVEVATAAGDKHVYDAVVLATHSDTALQLRGSDCSEAEHAVLSDLPYNGNHVYLHTDTALMPKTRSSWASWNFLGASSDSEDAPVAVTYWLNLLQNLPAHVPQLFCTLNPHTPPKPDTVYRKLYLTHPACSTQAVAAQEKVPAINGTRGVYYAGAWCGYGFHEDGLKSAIRAVGAMGFSPPWGLNPRATSPFVPLINRVVLAMIQNFGSSVIRTGQLRFILPTGQEMMFGSPAPAPGEPWRGAAELKATIRVFDTSMFVKLLTKHDVGLGESYMDEDFKVDSLPGLVAVLVANADVIQESRGQLGLVNWLGSKLAWIRHLKRANTIEQAKTNISQHYDAGNDMYRLFLDQSMTYSCGIHAPGRSLQDAQIAKLDQMIQLLNIQSTDVVLEVGCGWGSFAIRAAAKTGCRVTGVTISREQLEEGRKRVVDAGLEDKVSLIFCDYRQIPGAGTFDKVASIEMLEAVGHEHLVPYFQMLEKMLKPGGRATIQVICGDDSRYDSYAQSSDFIRQYIFPAALDIGRDYAVTLRAWRQAWLTQKSDILALGYDQRFWRMYNFYFAYCESAFDASYIYDYQLHFVKSSSPAVPPPPSHTREQLNVLSGRLVALPERQYTAECPTEPAPFGNDPVLQVLLAIYYFQAGMLVMARPYLLITLLASFASAGAIALAVPRIQTALKIIPEAHAQDAGLMTVQLARVVFGVLAGTFSVVYGLAEPAAWDAAAQPQPGYAALYFICVCAGFFAALLWAGIYYQVYKERLSVVINSSLMLSILGAAAVKHEHTAMLALMLVAMWDSAIEQGLSVAKLLGWEPRPHMQARIAGWQLLSLLLLRVVPHMYLGAKVVGTPGGFDTPLYYWTASVGVVGATCGNVARVVRRVGRLLKA